MRTLRNRQDFSVQIVSMVFFMFGPIQLPVWGVVITSRYIANCTGHGARGLQKRGSRAAANMDVTDKTSEMSRTTTTTNTPGSGPNGPNQRQPRDGYPNIPLRQKTTHVDNPLAGANPADYGGLSQAAKNGGGDAAAAPAPFTAPPPVRP